MTMKKTFVNSTNVRKIAQSLLELEIHHLQEKYHLMQNPLLMNYNNHLWNIKIHQRINMK